MKQRVSIYKSKLDWWLAALIYGITIVSFLPAVIGAPEGWPFALLLLTLGFEAWTIHGYRYEIDFSGKMTVVSMFIFRSTYNIADITHICHRRTWLSAPAASLDRIVLSIGRKKVIISPDDKYDFITDLRIVTPKIEVEQEDWIPADWLSEKDYFGESEEQKQE